MHSASSADGLCQGTGPFGVEKFKDLRCVLGSLVGLNIFGALIEVTETFAQHLNDKPPSVSSAHAHESVIFRSGSAEWWLLSVFSGDWRRFMRVRTVAG